MSWLECGCFNFLLPADARLIELRKLKPELKEFINKKNCGPIMFRLAWHDAGTYDQRLKDFPERGGAIGGNWYDAQLSFPANAGLTKARDMLKPFADKYPNVSPADLMHMAAALAVEVMGGPAMKMTYGRFAVADDDCCVKPASRKGFTGNAGLPDGEAPFGCGASTPAQHLRNVFGMKMGFTDQDIVALSGGGHTVGRVYKERSGACPFGYGDAAASKYAKSDHVARHDGAQGIGMAGGQPWCKNWLSFDNEYFTQPKDEKGYPLDKNLVWLSTDACIFTDPEFKKYADIYTKDQDAFFKDFEKSWLKMCEQGAWFDPPEGLKL